MKKLLLCLLTLSCVNSLKTNQFIEDRAKIASELWQDVKTMVIVHPYATVLVTAAFIYFIFWYSSDTPCCEGVPQYTQQNMQMHVCIPGKIKRPANFWKKSVQPIQEEESES